MIYWQHETPIACPVDHPMLWLGSVYWLCEHCKVIYVQTS